MQMTNLSFLVRQWYCFRMTYLRHALHLILIKARVLLILFSSPDKTIRHYQNSALMVDISSLELCLSVKTGLSKQEQNAVIKTDQPKPMLLDYGC